MENKKQTCEICGYEEDTTKECPSCHGQLCNDCHLAHADDIQSEGQCNPDLI